MGEAHSSDDPGWPSFREMVFLIFPGLSQMVRRGAKGDGLMSLRMALFSFSAALVLFGIILPTLGVPKGTVLPWLPLLVAGAVFSVLVVQFLVKPLDCSSPAGLAASYRARFFLVIAFSEVVALFGFVFVFIGAPLWIYYLGAAFALYRFWTVFPPTRAGIARDQERLAANGCGLSLVAALRGVPPAPPPPPPRPSGA